MEFTLLGAVFVAIVPLYLVLYWEAKRGNAIACTRNLWDLSISAIVAGVFFGRLTAMIIDGVNPIANPADILIIRGGVSPVAASLAAVGTAAWIGRTELWAVLDGLAAASLAGLGGWHAGCVVRASCLGTPSDLPWAIAQEGSTVTRHPVEVYAALLLLTATVAIALWRRRDRIAPGVATGIALGVTGAVRLITEPMRPHFGVGMWPWYLAAALGGAVIAIWRSRTNRPLDD